MSVALASAVALALPATGTGIAAEDSLPGQFHELSVRVENGLVSAEIVNAPLVEAVRALARQSDFEVHVDGDIDRRVSLSRNGMEIVEVLGELLQNCSWFSVFSASASDSGTRLSQVWILPSPECRGATAPDAELSRQMHGGGLSFARMSTEDLAARRQFLRRVISGSERASMDDLLTAVRDSRDASITVLSAMALGRVGGPEARDALLEALGDENAAIRSAAVRSLARGWGNEAVVPLGAVVLNDPDIRVVRVAAQQLMKIGGAEAWAQFQEAKESSEPKVRTVAEKALSHLENAEAMAQSR